MFVTCGNAVLSTLDGKDRTGSVPITAFAKTRQLDPRQRAQTRPSDQLMEPHPVGAAPSRVGGQSTINATTDPGS